MLAGTLDIEKGVGEDAKEELVDIAGKKPHGNGTLRWLQLLELRAMVTCSTNAYRSRTTRLLFGPNNSSSRNLMGEIEPLRLRVNQITNYGNLGIFSIHKYQNCADGPQSTTGMSKRGLAAKVVSEKITDHQRVLSFCP